MELPDLFADIVQEIIDGGRTATRQALREEFDGIIQSIPMARALRRHERYGIYQGIVDGLKKTQFLERFHERGSEQKQRLAEHCLVERGLNDIVESWHSPELTSTRRVFFESGSTIAHLIGKFAQRLSTRRDALAKLAQPPMMAGSSPEKKHLSVLTNNLIGIEALAGVIDEVEPVQGGLDLKYYGFLPFDEIVDPKRIERDHRRYFALVSDIGDCTDVFATCSTFSFVVGPLVGSRANCITKSAIYEGAFAFEGTQRNRFSLCFHFEKIVPLTASNDLLFEVPGQKSECQAVFSYFDKLLIEKYQNSKNRSEWHDAVLSGKVGLKYPMKSLCKAWKGDQLRSPRIETSSWIYWLKHIECARVLISLPFDLSTRRRAIAFLRNEMRFANELAAVPPNSKCYFFENEKSLENDGVASIRFGFQPNVKLN